MKMDEYVPEIRPTMMGSENSRIDATPNMYTASIVISVVKDVLMVRGIVSRILRSAISIRVSLLLSVRLFSRMRSNTTMVSLMEYPTMVRHAAIIGIHSHPKPMVLGL